MNSTFYKNIKKYYLEKGYYSEKDLETLVKGKMLTESEKNELIKLKKETTSNSDNINTEIAQ